MLCYQCGKCTAGCPTAYAMDLTPRQAMRAIQWGLKEELLQSSTFWVCLSCQTCSVRCPREIDIARVMEALRHLALAEERPAKEKGVTLFHRLFLSSVRSRGRIWELGLGGAFNLLSRRFFANMKQLPAMLRRGKLPLWPSGTRGAKELRAIFDRVEAEERSMSGMGDR